MLRNLLLITTLFSSSIQANSVVGPIDLNAEIECLALNIYHEARSERTAGMWAVADVTINRVKSIAYPDTVCEVVYQGPVYESWKAGRFPNLADEMRIYNPVKGKCQFSWYCDGAKDDVNKDSKAWRYSLEYASIVLSGRIVLDITEGATHYHATYVRPAWAKTKTRTTRIDRHIFYRWEK